MSLHAPEQSQQPASNGQGLTISLGGPEDSRVFSTGSGLEIKTHREGENPLGAADFAEIYKNAFVVILRAGNSVYGVMVEHVEDMQEIVVKPTSQLVSSVPYFSGNTILGDGSVIMIIDPNGLAEAVGNLNVGSYSTGEDDEDEVVADSRFLLMLFKTTEGAIRAIPLGVVARLEDIDFSNVEFPGGKPVIQYRGTLMPLIATDASFNPPSQGHGTLIVFSDQRRSMGLLVQEIIDIIEEDVNVTMTTDTPGYIGSAVINGRATDIIDAEYYWKKAFHHQIGQGAAPGISEQRRVLFIDSNRFYCDIIMPYLSTFGFQIVFAKSIEEAMGHYNRGVPFNAIVSNLSADSADIYNFVRSLREGGVWAKVPVFGLTESGGTVDVETGYMAGFTDFIPKENKSILIESLKNIPATNA